MKNNNVVIKRENFRGKYYLVARSNGRIRSRKKWTQSYSKEQAVRQFKKTRSFNNEIIRRKMNKVFEVTDNRAKPTISKRGAFYYIRLKFSKNIQYQQYTQNDTSTTITVRSRVIYNRSQINNARIEAERKLEGKLGQAFSETGGYDIERGKKVLNKFSEHFQRQEGIVRYSNV